jgi:hypothetical protein
VFINDTKYFSVVEKAILLLKSLFENDNDPKVCRLAAWALGSLCRPFPSKSIVGGNAPADLSYLPESSLLRNLYNHLQSSLVGEGASAESVASAIHCLASITKLPPLRWDTLILNLMKAGFGMEVKRQCIAFCCQHLSDNNLVALVAEWTDPARFIGGTEREREVQHSFLHYLSTILSIFPSNKCRAIVSELLPYLFEDGTEESRTLVLSSLQICLHESTIPAAVISEIHTVLLSTLYEKLPSPLNRQHKLDPPSCALLELYSQLLKELPFDLVQSKVTLKGSPTVDEATKVIYLISLLTPTYFPFTALQSCRTWCLSQERGEAVSSALALLPLLVTAIHRAKSISDKSKWLFDTLDALPMCLHPSTGIHLLTLLTLCWNEEEDLFALFFGNYLDWWRGTSSSKEFHSPGSLLPVSLVRLLQDQAEFHPLIEGVIQRLNSLLVNPKCTSVTSYLAPTLLALTTSREQTTNQSNTWLSIANFYCA